MTSGAPPLGLARTSVSQASVGHGRPAVGDSRLGYDLGATAPGVSGGECAYDLQVANRKAADGTQALELLALHSYYLNASFLRDVFMRRVKRGQSPETIDPFTLMDHQIAMSLWYATLYVVIEGWREAKLADPDVDALLADSHADRLRRFRNQVFHYQREYDNPRVLEFLGEDDADAKAATDWVRRTHAALGRAIERAVEERLGHTVPRS